MSVEISPKALHACVIDLGAEWGSAIRSRIRRGQNLAGMGLRYYEYKAKGQGRLHVLHLNDSSPVLAR
jgi:hypothetical protein